MREKIMRHTFKLLLEKGLEGVSITDIQKSVGMSRALIYHYFKNKDELLKESCRTYFILRYHTAADASIAKMTCLDIIDVMIDTLKNIEKELSSDSDSTPVRIENYNILFYNSIRKYKEMRDCMRQYSDYFLQVFKKGIERGEIKKSVNPETLSNFMLYVFDGVSNYHCQSSRDEIYKKMRSELLEIYKWVKA